MSTYVIGDVHGCYYTLRKLLQQIKFNKYDTLWFAGDLINKGPSSLDVLNFIKALTLKNKAVCVLGNHEIYFLMLYYEICQRKNSPLNSVLNSAECSDLVNWIRGWPLIYAENKFIMVHAGVLPCWSIYQAQNEAMNIQTIFKSKKITNFLRYKNNIKNENSTWKENLQKFERASIALDAFTCMRFCIDQYTIDTSFHKSLIRLPTNSKPWYSINQEKNSSYKILFGHWSSLGLKIIKNNISLDSGCVWGRQLSAYRLDDDAVFSEELIDDI